MSSENDKREAESNKNSKVSPGRPAQEPKRFAFLGYEVGGWGALLAFVISVVTLGLTAVDRWVLGSNPVAIPPENINIVCQRHDGSICPSDSSLFVTGVPIILLNDTAAPHSFTVVSSDLTLEVLNENQRVLKSIELAWHYFGDPVSPIGVVTVAPQMSVSREVQYHPRRAFDDSGVLRTDNFWKFKDFQKFVADDQSRSIRLSFIFEIVGKTPSSHLTASCVVPIDRDFKSNAALGTYVLFSRECFAD